jgi:plastocyanin
VPLRAPPARSLALLGAVACAAALGACEDGTPDDAGGTFAPPVACSAASATDTVTVRLSGMQFIPYCVTVPAGVALTFTNADFIEHTVTAPEGQPETFDSGILYAGQQFSHVFSRPGTVRVHCRIHPQMSGVVIVR